MNISVPPVPTAPCYFCYKQIPLTLVALHFPQCYHLFCKFNKVVPLCPCNQCEGRIPHPERDVCPKEQQQEQTQQALLTQTKSPFSSDQSDSDPAPSWSRKMMKVLPAFSLGDLSCNVILGRECFHCGTRIHRSSNDSQSKEFNSTSSASSAMIPLPTIHIIGSIHLRLTLCKKRHILEGTERWRVITKLDKIFSERNDLPTLSDYNTATEDEDFDDDEEEEEGNDSHGGQENSKVKRSSAASRRRRENKKNDQRDKEAELDEGSNFEDDDEDEEDEDEDEPDAPIHLPEPSSVSSSSSFSSYSSSQTEEEDDCLKNKSGSARSLSLGNCAHCGVALYDCLALYLEKDPPTREEEGQEQQQQQARVLSFCKPKDLISYLGKNHY